MRRMIADHMEGGFLENIIDMFKHDRGLYSLVPHLMADERGRVRLGTVALIEALRDAHRKEIIDAIPYLKEAEKDENGLAGQIIRESLEDLQGAEANEAQ
jgi:hypothetical protein